MNENKCRIQSPCIRNCCLSKEDVCLGCFRLLGEITGWTEADDTERRSILLKAAGRKAAHALTTHSDVP